ncbi:MAG: alpha amylase catalytic region [Mycobacterium sp.]|nr:alpha amylase catalytic region [Mycobacterium sp.]
MVTWPGPDPRMDHPFVYEVNTWPWLSHLSEGAGERVDLSTVPPRVWDAIADLGFDAVWLMGVWERSPAGAAVALANPELVSSFGSALPDWAPEDVVGSPYCVRRYEVDPHLGGRSALAAARSALADRGLSLILDFVPNHVAPDHPWTTSHPEYFVRGAQRDLCTDPASFMDVDGAVLARGRDPYFPAWPDVVQLNAFSPSQRAEAARILGEIADQCDGVRCDMAMLVINDVFAKTWAVLVGAPPSDEYWPALIGAVRRSHPDFTFIAEAYWDMEEVLLSQGFDYCYDKRLYDRLVEGDAIAVREHLAADPGFQRHLVRFVENHDEPRAAATFDSARHQAVTVATLTQTGVRLVHDGQVDGRRVRLPVFLGRSPVEEADTAVASFHRRLLEVLRDNTFRTGDWRLCPTAGWPGDDTFANLVSWCWDGDQRWLIVVNISAATASGKVRVPWSDIVEHTYRFADPITGISVIRSGTDLRDGLYVELGPWGYHVFRAEEIAQARRR